MIKVVTDNSSMEDRSCIAHKAMLPFYLMYSYCKRFLFTQMTHFNIKI